MKIVRKGKNMTKKMMFVFACWTLLIPAGFSAKKTEITLTKIKLFNDLVEINVPAHFTALLDHEVKNQYAAEKLPKVVLGDSLREVKLAFYSKKQDVPDAGVGAIKASILAEFLRDDLNLKELSGGIITVDGRDMSYMGVLHKSPKKFYRFYFLTIYQGLILSGELISPKKGYKSWVPVAEEIMKSLDIKGN